MQFGIPHFGQPAVDAFTQGGASNPVNISLFWSYTSGGTRSACGQTMTCTWVRSSCSYSHRSCYSLVGYTSNLNSAPALSWFKNAESRLNHHLAGLFGVSSLAWTGHLVHVAIPESRGQHVGWDNFLSTLPHPAGLTPFFTGNWGVYARKSRYRSTDVWHSPRFWDSDLDFLGWLPSADSILVVD